MHFLESEEFSLNFVLNDPREQEVSIGPDDGSVPMRQQIITQIMKMF